MTKPVTTASWRSTCPVDVVSFDCDATLSHLEGIDWLADRMGHGPAVEAMTYVAMRETGVCHSLYKDRLELVKPNSQLLNELADAYIESVTPDAQAVMNVLQAAGKTVCVLSAGLLPSVAEFAVRLGVNTKNVGAVDVYFDESGEYAGYEEDTLFVDMRGKAKWLQARFPDAGCLHIGDGLNDVGVKEVGVRLVGFGAGQVHEHMAKHCPQYIVQNSLAPLLSLALTENEIQALSAEHREVVEKGDCIIKQGGVRFETTPGAGVC